MESGIDDGDSTDEFRQGQTSSSKLPCASTIGNRGREGGALGGGAL